MRVSIESPRGTLSMKGLKGINFQLSAFLSPLPTTDLLNTPFDRATMRVPFPMSPPPPLQEKEMPLTHPKPYI